MLLNENLHAKIFNNLFLYLCKGKSIFYTGKKGLVMVIKLNKMLAIAEKSKNFKITDGLHNAPHLLNVTRYTNWTTRTQTFNKKTGELVATRHFLNGDNAVVAYDTKGNVFLDYFNRTRNGIRHTKENFNTNGLNDFTASIRPRYNDLTSG